jgi:AraC-like DNA-binding protein
MGCVAQVALQAGFSDQSQFSHHFKRFIGVTGKVKTPGHRAIDISATLRSTRSYGALTHAQESIWRKAYS